MPLLTLYAACGHFRQSFLAGSGRGTGPEGAASTRSANDVWADGSPAAHPLTTPLTDVDSGCAGTTTAAIVGQASVPLDKRGEGHCTCSYRTSHRGRPPGGIPFNVTQQKGTMTLGVFLT